MAQAEAAKRKKPRRVFVTPIYQRILANAVDYVVRSFNEASPLQSWISLKTLYGVSPLEVKADCKKMLNEITLQIGQITSPRSFRTAGSDKRVVDNLQNYLAEARFDFLYEIIESLIAHKYLERGTTMLTAELMGELERAAKVAPA